MKSQCPTAQCLARRCRHLLAELLTSEHTLEGNFMELSFCALREQVNCSAGANLRPRPSRTLLDRFLEGFAALNAGTLEAGIFIFSPLCGFLPPWPSDQPFLNRRSVLLP